MKGNIDLWTRLKAKIFGTMKQNWI